MDKNLILEDVLEEFTKLAEIPRPSGHEKKVSDYIASRLKELGLEVVQDQYNNIIANKKAEPGFEHVPLILFQGHMDMVCVADPGVQYDPVKDAIKVKNDGKYLFAEGTSLGADDGIGVASVIYLLTQKFVHGPLRAIFTVDEENGMTGARGLDKKYLENVKYVINCDSEDYDVVTVGSAGSVRLNFVSDVDVCNRFNGDSSASIIIKNLLGGHSGAEINQNRANAIKILTIILQRLEKNNICFEVADINGGAAVNAIAAKASADIVYNKTDENKIKAVIDEVQCEFTEVYGSAEEKAAFIFTPITMSNTVIDKKTVNKLIMLLSALHSGVYAMSQTTADLPELSANIGRVYIKDKKVVVSLLARSATNANLSFIKNSYEAFACLTGFKVKFAPTSPAWNGNADSELVRMALDIFKRQNNKDMKVEFIHGGLECNYFSDKMPQLEIISIGPNNIDIHTPQERLQLDTIIPQICLMKEMTEQIAEKGK